MNPLIIAKVIKVATTGVRMVGVAFMDAYRAAAKGKILSWLIIANAESIASGTAHRAALDKSANEGTRISGMELREALLVLNLEKGASVDQIKEKYETMFKANDPANGGSLYLQAKIFRAKERLDFEKKSRVIIASRRYYSFFSLCLPRFRSL